MTPFEAYTMFLALKQHFTTKSYDYIKYNKKIKIKYENFLKRSDRKFFYKLSRHDDIENFIIANLVENSNLWVTDLCNDKAEKTYIIWKKRNDSLTYSFRSDIVYLDELGIGLKSLLRVSNNQYPKLFTLILENKISPETLLIINELTGVLDKWNEKIKDDVLWPEYYLRWKKYRSFFNPSKKLKEYSRIIIDTMEKE